MARERWDSGPCATCGRPAGWSLPTQTWGHADPADDTHPLDGPFAPVFRVARGMGETVHAGALVYDRTGAVATFVRAVSATMPRLAGKVVISRGGVEAELSARVFGLTVTRVIREHSDPVTGRWCGFGGVSQRDGACPLHDGPDAA